MRHSLLVCLAAVLLAAPSGSALAQQSKRTQIEKVRVGFPLSVGEGGFKAGAWAPVTVTLIPGSEGVKNGRVVVETTDSDDVKNQYTIALPPLLEPFKPYEAHGVIKPGVTGSEFAISVWAGDQRLDQRNESAVAVDPGLHLYLALGSQLREMRNALRPSEKQENEFFDPRDTGLRRIAYSDDVLALPVHWFGYEGMDLVILATSNRDFLIELLNDHEKGARRYAALAEWVRRGGKLVVCAGRNQDVVRQLDERQPMLPAFVAGVNTKPNWQSVQRWLGGPETINLTGAAAAKLEPKPGRVFRPEPNDPNPEDWMIVRGIHGLGRVTLLAFDVDVPPFSTWRGREGKGGQLAFWNQLFTQHSLGLSPQQVQQGFQQQQRWQQYESTDLGGQLQYALEEFEEVPVISFGWVALFILLYILIVGPLDYFFLKKVVKRLELTWITFPLTVVVISAIAYFAAYYIKGNDQRINKIDLVDIDLHGNRPAVFGQTWFTIFSPRIQHYTIGLEPAADVGWASAKDSSVMLSWLGRPDQYYRTKSHSLFRRTYEYEPDGSGLRGVPIPVWSTKSFTASWAASAPEAENKGLIKANLTRSGTQVSGEITNQLPVDLQDVVLLLRRGDNKGIQAHTVGTLPAGVTQRVDNVLGGAGLEITQWVSQTYADTRRTQQRRPDYPYYPGQMGPREGSGALLKRILFHPVGPNPNNPNETRRSTSLQHLDQSWRLTNFQDELILFARVPRFDKSAEDVTTDAKSPTRLWLGDLPKSGAARPPIQGLLSQETYVRVFIPIRPEAGERKPAEDKP